MIWIYAVLCGIFTGIMVPTVMLSLTPILTIRFLEILRLLKKNEVSTNKEMYIGGAGYARRGLVYKYNDPGRQYQYATKKVVLRIFVIGIIIGLGIGVFVAGIINFRIIG